MQKYILAIDHGTTSTRAVLFDKAANVVEIAQKETTISYPHPGWVEQDANEIWLACLAVMSEVILKSKISPEQVAAIGISNQRETSVLWDASTGLPVSPAIVWQSKQTKSICDSWKEKGYEDVVKTKTGLRIDPYFSASKIRFIFDQNPDVYEKAKKGEVLFGTMDSWIVWKLSGSLTHITDVSNASRTLLFNIHTLDWDEELLKLFTIPRNMMPEALPCDAVFGETTIEGLFKSPIQIAGVLGDSHGALTGQMCFEAGMGKVTYGTGSSVMVNIGEEAVAAPEGLVTSVGFSALGKVYYAFEGNIHCTGATIKWMVEKLGLVDSFNQIETLATSVKNNDGVYLVPAFTGLGAPWWKPDAKAAIWGMTLNAGKAHVLRAGLESIAYQVKDLIDMMTRQAGIELKALRVDGGPTKNQFLMQFQADMLHAVINRSEIEEASALGAVVMNGFARKKWASFQEAAAMRTIDNCIAPCMEEKELQSLYSGWREAVKKVIGQNN